MQRNKHSNSKNNSIQFSIIYVPSQQPKDQLQTQHSLDTVITLYTNQNYRQALVEDIIIIIVIIIIIIIIIQFNSCLYTCKLNSSEAKYKVITSP
jgi:hypothetical protein